MLASLLGADASLRLWFTSFHTAWLDIVMAEASLIGQAGFVWLVLGIFATLRRPALAARLWQLALVVLLSYLVVDHAIKPAVGRPRPFDVAANVRVVGPLPDTRSFPSGHAASAFGGAFVVTLMLPGARWALWGLAALIALSRLYVGVHYPLDVIAGACIGLAVAVLVTGGRAWYSQRSLTARSGAAR